MLMHISWKNAAWLCQLQRRNMFRVGVCHINKFCALNNNDSSFEDFESLAVSAVEKEISDVSSESEIAYFTSKQLSPSQESTALPYKKTSLKQRAAYTNKVLYGPLLETSAERKRSNKIFENENEIKQKPKKRKKPKKNKPVLSMHPLISKPENAHLLGIFPGDESKCVNKLNYHKVKVEHQHETDSFSTSREGKFTNKILFYKKLPKDSFIKYENLVVNTSKTQKLYVASWKQEKELAIHSTSNEGIADESKQNNEDHLSEHNAAENTSTGSTHSPCSYSDVKTRNDEIENFESFRGNSSLVSIDSTYFTSVPNIVDIEMMASFPLEKTESPNTVSNIAMDTAENIRTIGMFDNGYQKLPSVSKILEATMPEDARRILERWKAKMIKELGEEGFEEYRKGIFEKGKLLHGCLQSELTGISPSLENMPTVQGAWTSISHVLPKISNVSVLESRLVHPYLYYQGAVDCVAAYKGMPMLIDWKTSSKPKLTLKSMFDSPLQVAAYLGALNYDDNYQLPHKVQSAMLVVAYDTGLPAHVHIIDNEKCQAYWKAWCARLVQFWRQLEVKESA